MEAPPLLTFSSVSPKVSPSKRKSGAAATISLDVINKLGSDDGKFWISLLQEGMGDQLFKQQEHLATLYLGNGERHIASMEELSEEFDQTHFGTETLFSLFDDDESGTLTHEEFHDGLVSQNLLHFSETGDEFAQLVKHVDTNNDGKISLEEFQVCLERLRLARLHLLAKNMRLIGKTSRLHCVDYDSQTAVFQLPVKDRLSFFFAPDHLATLRGNQDINGDVTDSRWIHMTGHDNLMVLRLAVKYGLHPLGVADALNLHQKAPVCSQYGKAGTESHEDLFVVCPQLRLTAKSSENLEKFQAKESEELYRQRSGQRGHVIHQQFDVNSDTPPVRAIIEHMATGMFLLPKSHLLISMEIEWKRMSTGLSLEEEEDQKLKENQTCIMKVMNQLKKCCQCGKKCGGGGSGNENGLKHADSLSRARPSFSGGLNKATSRKIVVAPRESKGHHHRAPAPPNGMPPILQKSDAATSSNASSNQQKRKRRMTAGIVSYPKKKLEDDHGANSILPSVLHNLSRKYTMLRRSGIQRLLHNILGTIVKNYQPIARAFRIELEFYQSVLQVQQASFRKPHVNSILRIKRELKSLTHQLQPIRSVMTSLSKKTTHFEDVSFFQDIEDALTQMLFEIETCTELVIELNESFNHYRDRRMNDVLYVLTIVTTCVIPTQLFTGVFGMNFASESNALGLQDPFLRWEHGYKFFWIFSVITTMLGAFVFRTFI